jgi:hypothetical protein
MSVQAPDGIKPPAFPEEWLVATSGVLEIDEVILSKIRVCLDI